MTKKGSGGDQRRHLLCGECPLGPLSCNLWFDAVCDMTHRCARAKMSAYAHKARPQGPGAELSPDYCAPPPLRPLCPLLLRPPLSSLTVVLPLRACITLLTQHPHPAVPTAPSPPLVPSSLTCVPAVASNSPSVDIIDLLLPTLPAEAPDSIALAPALPDVLPSSSIPVHLRTHCRHTPHQPKPHPYSLRLLFIAYVDSSEAYSALPIYHPTLQRPPAA